MFTINLPIPRDFDLLIQLGVVRTSRRHHELRCHIDRLIRQKMLVRYDLKYKRD